MCIRDRKIAVLHHKVLICLALLIAASAYSQAENKSSTKPVKPPLLNRKAWTLSLSGTQHSLKSGDGDHLIGIAAAVGLGYSYIGHNWIASGRVDFITGPYQSSKQQDLTVDFSGIGIDVNIGFSAENKDLRSYPGGYGFLLGVSYFDSIGRSVGERTSDLDGVKINNWVMRINSFSVYPAVFFTWLQPARQQGNSPDLLLTRIEGYLLSIGISIPIQTEYRVRFEADELRQSSEGDLNGYSILVNFTTLFGV